MSTPFLARVGRALAALADAPSPDLEEKPEDKPKPDETSKPDDDPAKRAEMHAVRVGVSGQEYSAGTFSEEYHADLDTLEKRTKRFNELRVGDSVVVAQLKRRRTPILQAQWSIEPAPEPVPLPSEQAAMDAEAAAGTDDGEDQQPGQSSVKPAAKKDGKPAPVKAKPATESARPAPRPLALVEGGPMPADEEPPAADRTGTVPDDEGLDTGTPEDEAADIAKRDASERLVRVMRANLLGDGPAEYRMRTSWRQFISEALNGAHAFGFSVFERTLRPVNGSLGAAVCIRGLHWMHPRSVVEWRLDHEGELLGVVQLASQTSYKLRDAKQDEIIPADEVLRLLEGDKDAISKLTPVTKYERTFVPASRLVVFPYQREGDNYEGLAEVRAMYGDAVHGAFLRKCQRVDASNRAISIPRVHLGPSATPEVKAEAIRQAQRMRAGDKERAYVVETDGVEVGYVKAESGAPDLTESVRATESRIRMLAGTEFSGLGSEGSGGSYSIGQVQAEYFNLTVLADAEWLRQEIQRQIVEPLAAINSGAVEPPVLRVSDVVPRKGDVDNIIKAKGGGLLTWTVNDEQEFRRWYNLAPLSDEEMSRREQQKEMAREAFANMAGASTGEDGKDGKKPKPDAAKKPGAHGATAPPVVMKPPAELAAVSPHVRPTPHEQAYSDLDLIRRRLDELNTDFVQAARTLRDALVLDGVKRAEIRGSRVNVPRLSTKALRQLMLEYSTSMREFGRETAEAEIARQLKALRPAQFADPPTFDPYAAPARQRGLRGTVKVVDAITEELETVVDLNVKSILDKTVLAIQREMLDAFASESTDDDARDAARRALLDKSTAELEAIGREFGSRSFNNGRAETTEAANEALAGTGLAVERVRRSASRDGLTCNPCLELDGTVVDVESEDYWRLMPPAECDGGPYCRCQYELIVEESE